MVEDVNYLKSKINSIYKKHLILDYYLNKILRDTLPTEENLRKIKTIKENIIKLSLQDVQVISNVTSKNFSVNDYIIPMKLCADFLVSEFFFQLRGNISNILVIYESNLNILLEELKISPLDMMKVNNINFI